MRAAAILLLVSVAATLLPAPLPPPAVFVEQAPRRPALTRVLFLDADGAFASMAGTLRGPTRGPARLDSTRPYQVYCGTWRRERDDLVVRDTLGESFGPPAPPDAGHWREYRLITKPGALDGPGGTLSADGVRYQRAGGVPLDTAALAGLRRQCTDTRRHGAKG